MARFAFLTFLSASLFLMPALSNAATDAFNSGTGIKSDSYAAFGDPDSFDPNSIEPASGEETSAEETDNSHDGDKQTDLYSPESSDTPETSDQDVPDSEQ